MKELETPKPKRQMVIQTGMNGYQVFELELYRHSLLSSLECNRTKFNHSEYEGLKRMISGGNDDMNMAESIIKQRDESNI